jgi:hypothetical protein
VAYTRTRDWATVDYYATLGVDTAATDEDIARAFRSLAKQLHPDAGVPVEAAERFKHITVAYEVLSNERLRRDYDAVRGGLLPRVRARPEVERPSGPPPRFRAPEPKPLRWTTRRAWMAFVGGLLVFVLGIGASLAVIALQHRDAQRRSGRVAVDATVLHGANEGTISFRTTAGNVVRVDEPARQNPGLAKTTMAVLYDPGHPSDVIADESYAARNITLWIVAIKFLIGGPVFAILGWRALRRLRAAGARSATGVR